MFIKEVSNIKGCGIFNDANSENADDFKKFNVVYGWNGSGKTTFSRLLNFCGNPEGGKTELVFNDDYKVTITHDDDTTSEFTKGNHPALNQIHTFNQDFVTDNISWESLNAEPIILIGQDKKEAHANIVALENQNDGLNKQLDLHNKAKETAQTKIEKVYKKAAKEVSEELFKVGGIKPLHGWSNEYKNYNAKDVRVFFEKVKEPTKNSDFSYEEAKAVSNQTDNKSELEEVSDPSVKYLKLTEKIKGTLLKTLEINASEVASAFQSDQTAKEWCEHGVEIHKSEDEKVCKFCLNQISEERWSQLEQIFNNEYRGLITSIDEILESIEKAIQYKVTLPSSDDFDVSLKGDFLALSEQIGIKMSNLNSYLDTSKNNLRKKRERLDKAIDIRDQSAVKDVEALAELIGQMNETINKHNQIIKEFSDRKTNATTDIQVYILEKFREQVDELTVELSKADANLISTQEKIDKNDGELEKSRATLEEHNLACDELNDKMHSFLGREDLLFKTTDIGYQLTRHKSIAKNLSEGEENAIALIFFLTKLRENIGKEKDMCIVIDDPISSMDAQNSFQAFSFIRSEIEALNPKQAFLLTHNFQFYRNLKNWLHFNFRDSYNVYQFATKKNLENKRIESNLVNVDPLLLTYESEYMFIFNKIHKRSLINDNSETEMEEDYKFPNMIRKLLENFLSLKVPTSKGGLDSKLKTLVADHKEMGVEIPNTSVKRIERFCQVKSHTNHEAYIDFDAELLGQVQAVCSDIMEMIKLTDPNHYKHAVEVVSPSE